MKDFLFRLRVSLYLIWLNGGAYPDLRVRRFVWRWLRNGLRDLWNENLNDYYCCSGYDILGWGGPQCGCKGMTWREYWIGNIRYHRS